MKRTLGKAILAVKKVAADVSAQTSEIVSNVGEKITSYELEAELAVLYEKLGRLYVADGNVESEEFVSLVNEIKEKEAKLKPEKVDIDKTEE